MRQSALVSSQTGKVLKAFPAAQLSIRSCCCSRLVYTKGASNSTENCPNAASESAPPLLDTPPERPRTKKEGDGASFLTLQGGVGRGHGACKAKAFPPPPPHTSICVLVSAVNLNVKRPPLRLRYSMCKATPPLTPDIRYRKN